MPSSFSFCDQRLEAAEDHSLAVERHAHRFHSRIGHHLVMARVGRRFVGPCYPGENDLLTGYGLDGAAKVRDLSVADIGFPSLDLRQGAVVTGDAPELLRGLSILILVAFRH